MEPFDGELTGPYAGPSARSARPDHIGRFRVTTMLGEGGMGVVYAGFDPPLERQVAIKTIRADLMNDRNVRERFQREARVVASISHRHVCRVYEIGEVDGHLFIVMELLEGESLAARLQRGPLPVD